MTTFTREDREAAEKAAILEKQLNNVEDYSGETDDGVEFVGELPDGHPLKFKQSEPVAWRWKYYVEGKFTYIDFPPDAGAEDWTPLYTTPQTKPLGDWIPVSERLPEDGQNVAFVVKNELHDYLNGRVLGGRYTAGICGGFSVPGMHVLASHWMPLPDAPAIEAEHGIK